MKKSLLYITYAFPPVGGAGIQRNVKFIKYLTQNGWDITVLAPENPSVPVTDDSFSDDIPKGIEIIRTNTWEPSYKLKAGIQFNNEVNGRGICNKSIRSWILNSVKLLFQSIALPDVQILWAIPSFRQAIQIVKKNNIQIIFASAPPFSVLLLACVLSRFIKIPFVIDFRDEWTDFYENNYHSHGRFFGGGLIRKMEKFIVTNSDGITMATDSFVMNIGEKYPNAKKKTISITNGYDPDDFKIPEIVQNNIDNKYFDIYYIGTIFNVTTPRYFLEACVRIMESENEYRDIIRVNFVGRITEEEDRIIKPYEERINIMKYGYIEHKNIIPLLKKADLLLVLVDSLDGGERIIAAKIFEYAYSGNFTLALVPVPGEISEFVNKARCGVCCQPKNIDRIADIIRELVVEWRARGRIEINPDYEHIKKYSRPLLAIKLSKFLEDVINYRM